MQFNKEHYHTGVITNVYLPYFVMHYLNCILPRHACFAILNTNACKYDQIKTLLYTNVIEFYIKFDKLHVPYIKSHMYLDYILTYIISVP